MSRTNFEAVWEKTRVGRKAMARKWFRVLRDHDDPEIRALHACATLRPPIAKSQAEDAKDEKQRPKKRAGSGY